MVTLIEGASCRLPRAHIPVYLAAQLAGAVVGVMLAHAMFGLDLVQHSQHVRSTHGEWLGEVVATAGLWFVIATTSRARPSATPGAVALYIVGAYWFTSSTSFANPAVTFARSLTDTFSGIRSADIGPFIVAQLIGGALAALLAAWLVPMEKPA